MQIRPSQFSVIVFMVMRLLFLLLFLESQEYDPVTMDPPNYDQKRRLNL
jgi:hypothetical protein